MTHSDAGTALLAAFGEYFAALDDLAAIPDGHNPALSARRERAGQRFQTAYRNIFQIAGAHFGRDGYGKRVQP